MVVPWWIILKFSKLSGNLLRRVSRFWFSQLKSLSWRYGRIFEPKDEDSKAIALFNEEVNADNRVEKLFLTLCDGIYLIRKKTS